MRQADAHTCACTPSTWCHPATRRLSRLPPARCRARGATRDASPGSGRVPCNACVQRGVGRSFSGRVMSGRGSYPVSRQRRAVACRVVARLAGSARLARRTAALDEARGRAGREAGRGRARPGAWRQCVGAGAWTWRPRGAAFRSCVRRPPCVRLIMRCCMFVYSFGHYSLLLPCVGRVGVGVALSLECHEHARRRHTTQHTI